MNLIEASFLILCLSYLLHISVGNQLYSSSILGRIIINLTVSTVITGLGVHLITASFNVFDLLWKTILLAIIIGAIFKLRYAHRMIDFSRLKEVMYPEELLRNIMSNLISNVIEFTDKDKTTHIAISTDYHINRTPLKVEDDGFGMDLDLVGTDIFKLRRTFFGNKGTKGFGPYVRKSRVEQMGGSISVKSQLGKGTTFYVDLGCSIHL